MVTSTDTEIIMTYVLFMSIMLFLTPFFAPVLFNVDNTDIGEVTQPVEAGIFEVVIGFINNLITRFVILINISTSLTWYGTIIGLFIGAYSVGAIMVLLRLIAEALP